MNDVDFNVANVEFELEKTRNDQRPEPVRLVRRSKLSFGKCLFFFLLGLVLFRVCGELLSFFAR